MKKVKIGTFNDFPLGKTRIVRAESVMVVVNHTESGFCAVENRCPHLGFPIGLGQVEGNVITCPFHGSKFDMCTGENLDWVTSLAGIPMPSSDPADDDAGQKTDPHPNFPGDARRRRSLRHHLTPPALPITTIP